MGFIRNDSAETERDRNLKDCLPIPLIRQLEITICREKPINACMQEVYIQ
jgi:hypothetical protein